jgi:PAS domain S-box-containing protein
MSIGPSSSPALGFPPEEAVYRSILDASVEGIWIVNQDGRLGSANSAIARMLGYEPEEMYGQQATDFFSGG